MTGNGAALSVRGLQVTFFTDEGEVRAVNGVSFDIGAGRTCALVGESGCGKSVTALSILRLVPDPPGKIVGGEILFEQENLLELSGRQMRAVRGNHIAMIFQEPMTSLNPVFTIGDQIIEAIELHQDMQGTQAWGHATEMLRQVGIADPEQRIREYPHQMSGGMRQRVMIAMALACKPSILIADEPTTALDVTVQAQILELFNRIKQDHEMSIIFITHDVGVIAEIADQVLVMRQGSALEYDRIENIFHAPTHSYTKTLLDLVSKRNRRV